MLEVTGDPYKGLSSRGFVHAWLGQTAEARRALEMLIERQRRNPWLSLEMDFMLLHYALGEMQAAFAMFNRLVARRSTEVLFLRVNPLWAELRGRPEFWAVLELHGLDRFVRGEDSVPPPRAAPVPMTDSASDPTAQAAHGLPHVDRLDQTDLCSLYTRTNSTSSSFHHTPMIQSSPIPRMMKRAGVSTSPR